MYPLKDMSKNAVTTFYLSDAQKEQVSHTLEKENELGDQLSTIRLIHNFVVSNGKADKKYMDLYDSLLSLHKILSSDEKIFSLAKTPAVFTYSSLFLSYLGLVDLIDNEEIEKISVEMNKSRKDPDRGNFA